MKAKTAAQQHPTAFQKVCILLVAIVPPLTQQQCILAYMSDTHLYATLTIAFPISPDFGVACSLSASINTSHLKRIRPSGPLTLGMSVRYGLLSIIMSLTYLSVKPGPFSDILQVCCEIT